MRRRVAGVTAAAALLLVPVAQSAEAHPPKQKTLRRLINEYRAEKDKKALKLNDTLVNKAHKQATAIADQGRLFQSSADQMASYARAAGCSEVGEIIGNTTPSGPHTLDTLLARWKASTLHNSIMLMGKWKHIGLGVHNDANGALWSAVLFCKPA